MNDFDVGRLLRLKTSIAAAARGDEVKPADAPSLTSSYRRMRAQVEELVAGGELVAEFNEMFPEIPEFQGPAGPGPRGLIDWHTEATAAGIEARRLLEQLSGWIEGLIEEQTLAERIQVEAAERVKQEKGFESV